MPRGGMSAARQVQLMRSGEGHADDTEAGGKEKVLASPVGQGGGVEQASVGGVCTI